MASVDSRAQVPNHELGDDALSVDRTLIELLTKFERLELLEAFRHYLRFGKLTPQLKQQLNSDPISVHLIDIIFKAHIATFRQIEEHKMSHQAK